MNQPFAQLRWAQGLAIAAILLALGAATAGCGPQEDPAMPLAATLPQSAIPTLDATAPAQVETATFALG